VHGGELLLHLRGREHCDVLETEGLDNALLDQIVQLVSSSALEDNTGPVDVDAILPLLARLVDQRHLVDVAYVGVEDVEADGAAVVSQLWVKAAIPALVRFHDSR
jgi:hypothetical protein